MVSFTGHEGSEPVISSMSPDSGSTTEVLKVSSPAIQHIPMENYGCSELAAKSPVYASWHSDPGSTAEVLKGSASATSHIPAENNDSSELAAGQPKAIRLRQLPSLRPGHAPVLVNEKQYEAILRLRVKRARISKPKFKKRRPRGPTGRFVAMGNQGMTSSGISLAPSSNPAVDFYGALVATNEDKEHVGETAYLAMGNQGMINPGISQAPNNIPAASLRMLLGEDAYTAFCYQILAIPFTSDAPRIIYWPFVTTNEDEEHVGESADVAMGNQGMINSGISQAPSNIHAVDFYVPFASTNEDEGHFGEAAYLAMGNQGMINPGISQAPGNIPAASLRTLLGEDAYTALCYHILAIPCTSDAPSIIYWPFVATNDNEEHVGESTDVAMGNQGMTNPCISYAPSSIPEVDFYGPFVATNEDEEHVGEAAYNSILNLESPDCTALLRIMMGDKYTPEVMEEFRKLACQESPDFTTLLRAMNNASYDEATDEGYYSVEKVLLKLGGWL